MTQRHIVLVGLPGAGKTTIGRLVAEKLNVGLIDFDQVIMRKQGMPISQIFGVLGEVKFRELESQVAENALNGPPAIIAPGGGWIAQPGQFEKAQAANCFIIYLRMMASFAAARAGGDGTRPLLVGDDPIVRMRTLLQEREPVFLKAEATVPNDPPKTAEQAAEEVVALARGQAGWP